MTSLVRFLCLCTIAFVLAAGQPATADDRRTDGNIIVNGQVLPPQTVQALAEAYGPIPAGAYWYDAFSGLWGVAGGPSSGQIMPGLALGGPLRADASRSNTGVFINSRQIHYAELSYLIQRFGTVLPGRYWLNAYMIGGYEGGPPIFNLRTAGGGGGGSGYNRNTIGGGLMSDGSCSGYLHPGGTTVMSGNC